jgi:hypothetical protein
MIRAHQPGSQPIDIPEAIPNPAVPQPVPAPTQTPKEPVKAPAPSLVSCEGRATHPRRSWKLATQSTTHGDRVALRKKLPEGIACYE